MGTSPAAVTTQSLLAGSVVSLADGEIPPVARRARLNAKSTTPSEASPFLTMAEAAEIAHVSRRTIGYWIEDERFISTRPIAAGSGRRLIDRASFMAFLGVGAGAA